MNRTTATCIAGIRSKTTSRIRIHFQGRLDFRFFAFVVGIVRQESAVAARAQPVVMMGSGMLGAGLTEIPATVVPVA